MEVLVLGIVIIVLAAIAISARPQASTPRAQAQRPNELHMTNGQVNFQLRTVNGVPDFAQFRQQLPRHGNYEFEHINGHGDRYRFCIMRVGESYRTYITSRIDYRGRPEDGHSTHRIGIGATHAPYICHKAGQEPRDLPTAAAVAVWWATRTSQYIRDGRTWS